MGQVDFALVRQVPLQPGQLGAVVVQQNVDAALADANPGDVRQEVVPHEKAKQHEVVDDALQVPVEGQRHVPEELVQVLAHHEDLDEAHVDAEPSAPRSLRLHARPRVGPAPPGAAEQLLRLPPVGSGGPGRNVFPQNIEVGLVRGQSQHNEVGVGPENAVAHVGVVPPLQSLDSNELQDLVLALFGHGRVRKEDLQVAELRVGRQELHNVLADVVADAVHEVGARRDHVAVPAVRLD